MKITKKKPNRNSRNKKYNSYNENFIRGVQYRFGEGEEKVSEPEDKAV